MDCKSVADGATSHCSIEDDSAIRVDGFDIRSRSEGMVLLFMEHNL